MRMVIILRDLQGKSYEELAGILGLPLGTVKSRVNRARIQLAKVLEGYRGGLS
jgi:RNA polymerase sigma-70 factor (ECF subfamily)